MRSVIFFLLMFQSFSLLAAEISLSIDRQGIKLDESFNLIFTANKEPDSEPDFSPLNKEFDVLGQRKSSNVNIINGRMQQSITWNVTLMAKRPGEIVIPEINFGKDKTSQAKITILENQNDPSEPETIFLETTVDTASPYVQGQVLFSVRLYFSQTPVNAALSEPEFQAGAVILQKLGDDKSYTKSINNTVYEVVERTYALFPQSSGELVVPSLTFRGEIGGTRNGFFSDPFFGGKKGKTIIKRSKPITLTVKPIPETFAGSDWLPAKSIRIEEEWSSNPVDLDTNEPVTRTVKLVAEGLPSSQLPQIEIVYPDEINQYPDQPSFRENFTSKGVQSYREDKTALIVNEGGEYQLGAIEIPWWNTETDSMELAKLAERRILVNNIAKNSLEPKEEFTAIDNVEDNSTEIVEQENVTSSLNSQTLLENTGLWKSVSAILAILWILTLFKLIT